jgi:hypothetical protein
MGVSSSLVQPHPSDYPCLPHVGEAPPPPIFREKRKKETENGSPKADSRPSKPQGKPKKGLGFSYWSYTYWLSYDSLLAIFFH